METRDHVVFTKRQSRIDGFMSARPAYGAILAFGVVFYAGMGLWNGHTALVYWLITGVIGVIGIRWCIVVFRDSSSAELKSFNALNLKAEQAKKAGFNDALTVFVFEEDKKDKKPREVLLINPDGIALLISPVVRESSGQYLIRETEFSTKEITDIQIQAEPKALKLRNVAGRFVFGGAMLGGGSGALIGAIAGALLQEILGPKHVRVFTKVTFRFPSRKPLVFTVIDETLAISESTIEAARRLLEKQVIPHIQECMNALNLYFTKTNGSESLVQEGSK